MFDSFPVGRALFAHKISPKNSEFKSLNIGCFDGALERHILYKDFKECHGVDVNQPAIEFAQKNARPNTFFKLVQSEALPFADQSFDVVFCLDTLEHVNNEALTISEIYRVLKPNGTLILSVPHDFLNFLDPDDLTRSMRNFSRAYISKKPLLNHPKHKHYNETMLRKLLSKFQIELVHKSGTPFFWITAMLYTAFGISDKILNPIKKLTAPLENFEYSLALPTGFNIMIKAQKKL